ncbi:allene oxide cyclase barrel-like domain-containing protein [Catellatospora citrea]|uniref:Allene oxide cyclase barrel-like domain-containing protein n=1 Tax=Catellatospora citrea TaxID=53366 RepID=A0A8J3KEM6_9ACTN|nr:hypothetical protein [Catellatospora citrea]RKE06645.1 hypothetical protein C8E86_1467 [Catellatospora citrea]GIF98641.1 hypothetical protein Cci01nite_37350 [Catellatospora citrea]
MSKIHIRRLTTAAALAIGLFAGPLASAAASAWADDTEVIQLVALQTQAEALDHGKKGLSLGDERTVFEDVYRDGKKIGDHSVVCTYVSLGPDALQCVGTFSLPDGQITAQALLHLPAAASIDIPITGGSGAYSTAQGYVHTVPAGETERHLTFHISR